MYGRPRDTERAAANYDDYVRNLAEHMNAAYKLTREQLKTLAERLRHTYDLRVCPAEFQPGDKVYYYHPRRYQGRTPKWSRWYTGPFVVVEQKVAVNYVIRKSNNSRPLTVHVDKLKLCLGGADDESTSSPKVADIRDSGRPSE